MVECDDCGRRIELGENRDERWEYSYGTFCRHCGPEQDDPEAATVVKGDAVREGGAATNGGYVHVSDRINPNRSEPLNEDETVGELYTRDHRQTTGWRAFDRGGLIEALEHLGDYEDSCVYLAVGERETQSGVVSPVLYIQPHDSEEHLVIVSGVLGGRDAAEFDRWKAEEGDDP